MKRKHMVFFTIVVLVAIVALFAFQMMDDGGLLPNSVPKSTTSTGGASVSPPLGTPAGAPGK